MCVGVGWGVCWLLLKTGSSIWEELCNLFPTVPMFSARHKHLVLCPPWILTLFSPLSVCRVGRRPVLLFSVIFILIFGLTVALSVNVTMFSTLRFFEGFCLAGIILSLYALREYYLHNLAKNMFCLNTQSAMCYTSCSMSFKRLVQKTVESQSSFESTALVLFLEIPPPPPQFPFFLALLENQPMQKTCS